MNFHFFKTVIFGYFSFWAKNTPKLQKLLKKRPKSSNCLIILHISSKKIHFSTLTFFLGPLTWSALKLSTFPFGTNVTRNNGRKKSRIRETKHLSTDADSSTDSTVGWTKNPKNPIFLKNGKNHPKRKNSKTSRDMPILAIYPLTRGL